MTMDWIRRGRALAVAGACALLFSAAEATAAPLFDITVWTGAPDGVASSALADEGHVPTGPVSAHFLYHPPINPYGTNFTWSAGAANLAGDFFDSASISDSVLGPNLSDFTSPSGAYASIDDFWASSLSDAGGGTVSFIRFQFYLPYARVVSSGFITDDFASMYDQNGTLLYAGSSAGGVVNGYGLVTRLTVDYVNIGGGPSSFGFTFFSIPEPSTWAMMLLGFGAAGAALRRRRERVLRPA